MYAVVSNEWADGNSSDTIYSVKNKSTSKIPILIEFQNQVSHECMSNVIHTLLTLSIDIVDIEHTQLFYLLLKYFQALK